VSTHQVLRSSRRAAGALAAVAISFAALATLAGSASALPSIGPTPTPSGTVTLNASPVTGLANGQTVTLTVGTGSGTTLIGYVSVHVCQDGFTSYGSTTFGFDGAAASRCVYQNRIVSGTLTGSDFEAISGPYAGTETTSLPIAFQVGAGTISWATDDGYGPFTLTADPTHRRAGQPRG